MPLLQRIAEQSDVTKKIYADVTALRGGSNHENIKTGTGSFLATVCIIDFIGMVLLTVYQVIMRYVFKSPSSVSEVLARYCFVWLILLSATCVFGQRDHICITFLKDKLTGSARRTLDIINEIVIIIFSGTILVYGGMVITTMNMLQYDSILKSLPEPYTASFPSAVY